MRKITTALAVLFVCMFAFNACCKKHISPKSYTFNSQPRNNLNEVHIRGSVEMEGSDPSAPEIGAAAWTSGGPVFMRAALKFDLTSIPADATITSAKLTLFSNHTPLNGNQIDANFGNDNTTLIQRITIHGFQLSKME